MTPKERAAMQQALETLESAPVQYDFNSYPMLVMTPDTLQTTLTALREALVEQAEQEPVAEVVLRSHKVGFGRTEERKDIVFLTDVEVSQKLYAAPVMTKDLTDDEIFECYTSDAHENTPRSFARAVIAADREKNK